MKTKRLRLSFPYIAPDNKGDRYRVDSITNSVEFRPAQFLTKVEVGDLCESKSWEVVIVPASEAK